LEASESKVTHEREEIDEDDNSFEDMSMEKKAALLLEEKVKLKKQFDQSYDKKKGGGKKLGKDRGAEDVEGDEEVDEETQRSSSANISFFDTLKV
tara:strand:+ start:103 stop:387 length:285 start_codon:yes stop_codon:yes gene_type:complete